MAADTLGDLLALLMTPANEQDRDQVQELTQKVQEVTGETVEVSFVDEGYTLYRYNYLVPNLEFKESFHACYPFCRR